MNNPYIIAFINGSSGRFIKYILYSLLTDHQEEIELNVLNSTHINFFYTGAENARSLKFGEKSIYETHTNFDPALPNGIPKILMTHQYPIPSIIQERLPNYNTVTINIEENDWLEVAGNTVHKNGVSMMYRNSVGKPLFPPEIDYLPWLQNLYTTVLGTDFSDPSTYKYDINETKKVIYALHDIWKKHKIDNKNQNDFLNPILNLENYPNFTVINYSEIYKKSVTGRYIALEKLEKLTNKVANTETFKNYEKYIIGRDNYLQKFMPWLLKEKPNN